MHDTKRMKYLVVDACDTMSRMSDRNMLEAAKGISEHLESLLLEYEENDMAERHADLVASCTIVVWAILLPLSKSMLAMTGNRAMRSKELYAVAPEP